MDCRFVKNEKIYCIIEQRINSYIDELNQNKKNENENYNTYRNFPFEIFENDIHIVKTHAIIKDRVNDIGDMFAFAIFPEGTELEQIIDSLATNESKIEFEITESTILKCEYGPRYPLYFSTMLYSELFPDSISIQPNDRIFNIFPSGGKLYHLYCGIEQKRDQFDKLIILEISAIFVVNKTKLLIFKVEERKYVDVIQEENTEKGSFQKITDFFKNFFNQSEKAHLKLD